MPNRILRDYTDSLRFDGISAEAERLFVRLIMKADDYGRFHAEPRLVRAACFPLTDQLGANDLSGWLEELSRRQLILRYETQGRRVLAIVNFGQRLKMSRARFPPPDGKPPDYRPASAAFREIAGRAGRMPPDGEGETKIPADAAPGDESAAGAPAARPPVREPDPPGGRPGEQPSLAQFQAECARYSVPPWYAETKFNNFAVRGWRVGASAVVWREAIKRWVVRDFENDGRPLRQPPRPANGANGKTKKAYELTTPPNNGF